MMIVRIIVMMIKVIIITIVIVMYYNSNYEWHLSTQLHTCIQLIIHTHTYSGNSYNKILRQSGNFDGFVKYVINLSVQSMNNNKIKKTNWCHWNQWKLFFCKSGIGILLSDLIISSSHCLYACKVNNIVVHVALWVNSCIHRLKRWFICW